MGTQHVGLTSFARKANDTGWSGGFPAPPINRFPHAEIDTPWLRASFETSLKISGWTLDKTVAGDPRPYLFEVHLNPQTGRLRAVVSPCDPTNQSPFESRDEHDRAIKGFSPRSRKELHDRALRAATHLHKIRDAQERWLVEIFKTAAKPVNVVSRHDGKPPGPTQYSAAPTFAVHDGWLITRREFRIYATRLGAGGSTSSFIVKGAQP